MMDFSSTPYRNLRLVDTAKLLAGAVRAKPLNKTFIAKLVGRLVGGLEASVIGVEGRADADRFSRLMRRALSDLVSELQPVIGEDLAPFSRLQQAAHEVWDIRILKKPGEPDPSEGAVESFWKACGRSLDALQTIGVADSYLEGIVCLQPGMDLAGLYSQEDDSVRISAVIFEESEDAPEEANLPEWAIIHEVAHRIWYRLPERARHAWENFIRERWSSELPTQYAGKAGADEAWADAVSDLALLPEGGVGNGASDAVLRAVQYVLRGATSESVTLAELQEVCVALATIRKVSA